MPSSSSSSSVSSQPSCIIPLIADSEYCLPLLRDSLSHQYDPNGRVPCVGFGHASARIMGSILKQSQHVFKPLLVARLNDTTKNKNRVSRVENQKLLQFSKRVFINVTTMLRNTLIAYASGTASFCDEEEAPFSRQEEKQYRSCLRRFRKSSYPKQTWYVDQFQEIHKITVTPEELAKAHVIHERIRKGLKFEEIDCRLMIAFDYVYGSKYNILNPLEMILRVALICEVSEVMIDSLFRDDIPSYSGGKIPEQRTFDILYSGRIPIAIFRNYTALLASFSRPGGGGVKTSIETLFSKRFIDIRVNDVPYLKPFILEVAKKK